MSEEGWEYVNLHLVQQQTWKCDAMAGPCSRIFYPCFCPCVHMSLSSFVLLVVYLVGSNEVSGNFSDLLVQQHTAFVFMYVA